MADAPLWLQEVISRNEPAFLPMLEKLRTVGLLDEGLFGCIG